MYYSAIGLLAVLILLIESHEILLHPKDAFERPAWKVYRQFLFAVLGYYVTDILWGVLESRKLAVLLFADTTVYFIAMAAGVLLSLYSAVILRMPDTSGLASIVFLCIVIAFPDIEEPLRQAAHRLLDVFVGTTIATVVNVIRLPRSKRRDLCFFVRTRDLVPDRFSHISPTALFQLNYLYNDGAKICLMSEHAPAFFMLQMSGIRLSVPQIVMDGAAIYDANENRYLQVETIAPEDSAPVRARLEALGISYFTYTIHNDKTCIFHSGALREFFDRLHQPAFLRSFGTVDGLRTARELCHRL